MKWRSRGAGRPCAWQCASVKISSIGIRLTDKDDLTTLSRTNIVTTAARPRRRTLLGVGGIAVAIRALRVAVVALSGQGEWVVHGPCGAAPRLDFPG